LAVKYNLAVVVANQISDQFGSLDDPFWGQDVDGVQEGEREDPRPQKGVDLSQAIPSSPFPESSLPGPDTGEHSQVSSSMAPRDGNPSIDPVALDLPRLGSLLSLDYQKPFFTGWGDPYQSLTVRGPADLKAPALGLVWTNQIACRIVLKVRESSLPVSLPINSDAIRQDPEPDVHPPSIPPPTIPDSEGSDDGSIGDDWMEDDIPENNDGTAHASRSENSPRQFPDGNPNAGPDCDLASNNDVAETSGRVKPPDIPTLGTRRIRTMEVVFSPWTSGSPAQKDSGDAWEDIDEEDEPTAEEQKVGCSPADPTNFEPSETAVEFEILTSSIRGLRRS
jgi:DNA repair protein RAD57